MNKIKTYKPTLVTKTFFKGYDDVSVINHGECFIWAYASFLMFENIELYDVDCHAFVKYRGRYYDSEVVKGSPDWQDLPATEGCRRATPNRYVNSLAFRRMWSGNPQRFSTTWQAIEAKAKRILNNVNPQIH